MKLANAILLAALLTVLGAGPLAADDGTTEAWSTYMARADYLMQLGRFPEARAAYQDVCAQFPGTIAVDRAVVGIARTHLAEEDYHSGITYLEDVLVKSSDLDSKTEARQLYCNLERAFRNARTRATRNYNSIKAEYDDISWWNIFKIFTKLGLRSDLRAAEKELQELTDLHNAFNPSLLLPDAYAEEPVAETTTETAASDTTTTDETTDETGDETADESTDEEEDQEALDRARAYELLQEDIARLIALIPDDKLDEVASIVSIDGSTTTTASAPSTTETTVDSVVGSELTSDTTDEIVSAPVDTVTTSAIDELPTEVIGEGDDLVTVSTDTTETTTVASDDATVGTTEATEVVSTDATETTTDAPAAASDPAVVTEPATTQASIGELRQAYIGAYQAYIRATQSGDPAATQQALADYRSALQTFTNAQSALVGAPTSTAGTGGTNDAPAAPSSTSPSASVNTSVTLPAGSVITTDRAGRVVLGNRNQPQVTSRRSLQQH